VTITRADTISGILCIPSYLSCRNGMGGKGAQSSAAPCRLQDAFLGCRDGYGSVLETAQDPPVVIDAVV